MFPIFLWFPVSCTPSLPTLLVYSLCYVLNFYSTPFLHQSFSHCHSGGLDFPVGLLVLCDLTWSLHGHPFIHPYFLVYKNTSCIYSFPQSI
ncbi:hypothetical protein EDB89DRAFT_2031552 [Lactarius sanguifluus]|nr:hypothetical protein EDB89DRAFT_2031552 [Lactarius sanguifluus]